MDQILEIFSEFNSIILLTLSLLLLLSWIVFFITTGKLNKRLKKFRQLLTYTGDRNIEQILVEYAKKLQALDNETQRLDRNIVNTQKKIKEHPQFLGMVRFNAFGNTGSDLSFAIALLDDKYDGFVLSSIYGREESRTYAKPIEAGKSTYHLTKEEEQAIEIAKKKKI